ncbi:polyprenyl glycosylphosphotransferase [Mycobacterium nebraskense]|uniref:Polyprenyl glycosylphosphotransferase n=2 Tax=Mycobacterium nebraskense TaxID=244292 RepID=A0A0F5N5C7_9MYCO|nr:sugar transferase [Mycobacterium nebraskense]KKC02211.1 polyprenyl glycosylphosphotransferase [Mycobacterium nebraskense]KLO35570.1 polyprenyl glycosylphosphotransferase [Mycobacterium nebraskense]ORW15849.1 polyprenyl glycosylphosphotransferase [Mycobacterium nebraskense]
MSKPLMTQELVDVMHAEPGPHKRRPAGMMSLPRHQTSALPVTAAPAPSPAGNAVRRWQHRYSHRLRISDTVIVCASVLLAQYVRFGEIANTSGYSDVGMTMLSFLFAALWLSSLAVFQTRSPRVIGAGIDEYRRIGSASFWTFGIIAMVTLLAKVDLARGYLAIALPVGTIGLLGSRSLWRKHIRQMRANGQCQTAVLAIGDRQAVSHLAHELARNPLDGYVVVGICIPGYGPPRGNTLTLGGRAVPILGDVSHAVAAIHSCGADTVAVTQTDHFGMHGIRELMWQLETMDVDVVVSPGVMDVAETRLTLRPTAGMPLLHVEKPQYEGTQRFQKQVFDFLFSLLALIGTAPILIAAAIAVKLTSKGPVFYPSERIGIDGKPFRMLKFRTMVDGADTQIEHLLALNEGAGGMLFKMRQDPRVTPVGRILRRFSIDELPQFINVLKGDMSVVGPRPPLRREVENYDGDVKRRLLVKPGVSGLWQVSGRSDLSWEESVRLDLSYVDNWSMSGDLMIIAKTIKAVLTSHGAY